MRKRIQPLLWAVAVVAIAHSPAVTLRVGILGIFAGGFGWLVIALALATSLLACVPMSAWGRVGPLGLFFASAVLSAVMGLHYVSRLQATGDEPEYLLMAQSLWKEGDLDLEDNWKRGDFLEYVPGMPQLPHGTLRKDHRPISTHSPGLPLLLAPIYALGKRPACVVAMALAAAALALETRALALKLTGDAAAALLAWAAAAGPPVLYYSFHLYTEVPSALAAAVSLRILLGQPGPAAAAVAALLVALLPWLHVKMIVLAGVLGFVAVWRLRGRSRIVFLIVVLLMAAGFITYYQVVFGTPSPLGLYGGRVPKGVREATPGVAAFGIFVDRTYGLLPYAPIWLLALAGFPRWLRRRWQDGLPYVLYALAIFLPIVRWRAWFAGFCPPARFLVPLVPVLGVCLALRTSGRRYGLAYWSVPLVLLGYVWTALAVRDPQELFLLHAKQDAPRLFGWLMGSDASMRYLPSFTWSGDAEWRVCVVWCVAIACLLILDALAERHDAVDRIFRSPALALAILITIGLGVDYWARRPTPSAGPLASYGQIFRLAGST